MSTTIWQEYEVLKNQNWLSAGFKGRGSFRFSGQLRFSGEWLGDIQSDDPDACLFVLAGARVQGSVRVARLVVEGTLEDVSVEVDRFEAHSGCRVIGRVSAEHIRVEEGALVDGQILSVSRPSSRSAR